MIRFDIDEKDNWFVGEDKALIITIYQDDDRTRQTITGWALSWMLKESLSDADVAALLTKTTTSGGITVATPVATVTVPDTDTDPIEPGRYWHELKRTDPGSETVLCHGRCVLRRGVHRS